MATDRPQTHFRWDRKAQEKRDAAAVQAQEKRDSYDKEFTAESRRKRSVSAEEQPGERLRRQAVDRNAEQLADATRCPGLKCAMVRCVAGPLATNHEIWLAIRTRVNAQTLKKVTYFIEYNSVGLLCYIKIITTIV